MKNPIDYIEKLIKRLERKIFWYIVLILLIIGGIVMYNNYKVVQSNLSEISFNTIKNQKAYCITASLKLSETILKQNVNLEILKNEKFSCYKDMETCYNNIKFVWEDALDFVSDYYKIEDTEVIKSLKYNNKNHIINAWWENTILKVYCLEVLVTPAVKEGNEND